MGSFMTLKIVSMTFFTNHCEILLFENKFGMKH